MTQTNRPIPSHQPPPVDEPTATLGVRTGQRKSTPPPPNRPAGWYRTMDALWAAEHYGFPSHWPHRGDEWVASDLSEWTYSLTGTDWWELSKYAPCEAGQALEAYLEDIRCSRARATDSAEAAEHIRTVLGWRPPAQVIESPEELDALPFRALVVDQAGVAAQHSRSLWFRTGFSTGMSSAALLRGGQLTVVSIPTETGDTQ